MSQNRKTPPTIYDVAKHSGLSIATISRVLNSPERVSATSRQKVMAAIDALGFVPNAEAKARGGQSTGQIGVITPYFTSPSFTDRLRGVAVALANSRYELVVYTVDSMERLNGYLSALPIRGNLAGLIIVSLPIDDLAAQRLLSNKLETVTIEYAHPNFSSILINDHAGGRLAAQHLLDQGHRRCAYIYFGEHPEYSIHPEIQRLAGYQQALAEAGVALPDNYIQYVPVSRTGIKDKLKTLLTLPEPPTAIFAPADDLAIRIIHELRLQGLHTPQDISVIGFDNIDISEHVDLTTISQSLVESGQMAAELLLSRLAEPDRPLQQVRVQAHLKKRSTTRSLIDQPGLYAKGGRPTQD